MRVTAVGCNSTIRPRTSSHLSTMTFNELAAGLEADLGPGARRPRHVPPAVLRMLAAVGATQPGRQAKAALVMDGYDLPA
jgi:hypothetical protein